MIASAKRIRAERQEKLPKGREKAAGGRRRQSCLVMREGAVEGRLDNWGEVVTR